MPEVITNEFAARVRLAMNMVGLSTSQLQRGIDLVPDRFNVRAILAGSEATYGQVADLALVLGVSATWLRNGTPGRAALPFLQNARERLEKSALDECDKQWVLQLLEMLPEA